MWHANPDQRQSRLVRARGPLIVAAIVGGAVLQHFVASAPPTPPTNTPSPTPRPSMPPHATSEVKGLSLRLSGPRHPFAAKTVR